MRKTILAGIALVFVAGTALAGAHGSLSDQRVKAMKGVGGAMKAIAEGKGDATENAKKANMLLSGMLELFPEGSVEYRAKPNIWTDWAGFEAAMNKSVAASEALVAASMTKDFGTTMGALKELGGTCKGCHTDYRGPKPE